jgi:hypothetical protein
LAPVGRPLAPAVLSGARAADGLDSPLRERLQPGVPTRGRVWVGDGKRRALDTRAYLARPRACSLAPLPWTGATAKAREAWRTTGVRTGEAGACTRLGRTHERGPAGRAAAGEECARPWGRPASDGAWRARVVGVRAPLPAHQPTAGWATRLPHAATALTALPPPRGRGKRPLTAKATRGEALDRVRTAPRGEGGRSVAWEKQGAPPTQDVGRGRGAVHREKRGGEPTRSPIPQIARHDDPIAERHPRWGWKACVTHAGRARRSWQEAVWGDRNAYRVARIFNRLQRRVPLAPLFVKRNEPMAGLTSLRTLGVRVFTGTAFVRRRSLAREQARRPG